MMKNEVERNTMNRDHDNRTSPSSSSSPSVIVVSATKPSKDYKLGIGLTTGDNDGIKIKTIASDGLFAGTDLEVGMMVRTINGTTCATPNEAVRLLKETEGRVLIVASNSNACNKGAAISSSSSVVAVITKSSKQSNLGMELQFGPRGKIRIASIIDPDGPISANAANTELKAGMRIDAVNGKRYDNYNEGEMLLLDAVGQVRIVASNFDPPRKMEEEDGCCLLVDCCCGGADCGCCCFECVIS